MAEQMEFREFVRVVLRLVAVYLALSVQYLALALVLPAFTITFFFTAIWHVASPFATLYLVIYRDIRVWTVWEFTTGVFFATWLFQTAVRQGVFVRSADTLEFGIRLATFVVIIVLAYYLTRQHVLRDLVGAIRARAQS